MAAGGSRLGRCTDRTAAAVDAAAAPRDSQQPTDSADEWPVGAGSTWGWAGFLAAHELE